MKICFYSKNSSVLIFSNGISDENRFRFYAIFNLQKRVQKSLLMVGPIGWADSHLPLRYVSHEYVILLKESDKQYK